MPSDRHPFAGKCPCITSFIFSSTSYRCLTNAGYDVAHAGIKIIPSGFFGKSIAPA
jgi:hypothetical protein